MAVVTQTHRPKSFRNRCVIEDFGDIFVLIFVALLFGVSVSVKSFCQRTESDIFLFLNSERSVMITQEMCPIRTDISTHKHLGKCIYLSFV